MTKPRLLLTLCGALLLAPALALACGPDSAKTHIGKLTGVDTSAGTFSIVDAETGQPLTFQAAQELLQGLAGHDGNVSVRYENMGGMLTATEVLR